MKQHTPEVSNSRLSQLDGLRGLAIIGVLLNHFLPCSTTILCGWTGVSLFFVLSGFLITRILLMQRDLAADGTHGRIRSLFIFYARRSVRIFPLYYIVIITMIVSDYSLSRRVAFPLVSYTYNHHILEGGKPHLWSLSVEEQFYLLWPGVVFFMPAKSLPSFMAAVFACGPAWRLACLAQGTSRIPMYFYTPASLDCLAAGALLALAERHSTNALERLTRRLCIAGLPLMVLWVVLCTLPTQLEWNKVGLQWLIGNTAMAIFFAYAVGSAVHGHKGWVGRLLQSRMLGYLGTISYGVYVLHMFMPDLWDSIVPGNPKATTWLKPFILTTMAILTGMFSWHAFEQPIQSLKRLFPYRQTGVPSAIRMNGRAAA